MTLVQFPAVSHFLTTVGLKVLVQIAGQGAHRASETALFKLFHTLSERNTCAIILANDVPPDLTLFLLGKVQLPLLITAMLSSTSGVAGVCVSTTTAVWGCECVVPFQDSLISSQSGERTRGEECRPMADLGRHRTSEWVSFNGEGRAWIGINSLEEMEDTKMDATWLQGSDRSSWGLM